MSFEEKQVNSTLIYDGKILKLNVDEVVLPDGKKSKRECVRHSGGAAVLFVKDNKIALVRQYRYLYGKEIYEIPAGKVNKGEDFLISAQRELEEETGYRADKLTHLGDIYPSPGYTDEIIHIYFAQEATFVGQKLDEGEFLNCKFFDVKDVIKMIESGEICDAKTVVAVYKYLLSVNK
jgi:ADP-ribose pyrophosphatase